MEEKTKKNKNNTKSMMAVVGFFLVIIAIVLVLLFLLSGRTTTSGDFPENEKTTSLSCSSSIVRYPLFEINDAGKKEMIIKVIANDDKIDTISLDYHLYYDNEEEMKHTRDVNHFKMNKNFEEDNMEADSLGATYSMMKDYFKFSLFAKGTDLNEKTAKYFLLNDTNKLKYSALKSEYKSQGFNCVENN